ncbi:hypothetical protein SAMN06295879_2594 [Agreia bicolorata]|uniref:Uncharacterized protein n=2 Tax=Agreia bicolorata TaxID=110935 RepID=A0A1T4Y9R1_9MICO|nr:hypothetical protein SAMN06295879_2594 [Agreia bicolorata]
MSVPALQRMFDESATTAGGSERKEGALVLLILIELALAGVGVWRVWSWMRGERSARPRWLQVVRVYSDGLAWVSGGVLVFWIGLNVPNARAVLLVILCTCVVSILLALAALRLLRAIADAGEDALWPVFLNHSRMLINAIRNGLRIIAPAGECELRFGFGSLDRLLSPGTFIRWYIVSLALLPVLLALVMTRILSTSPAPYRASLGALFGYNALVVVSCLTAGALLTFIGCAIATYAGILRVKLNVRGAFIAVAACTGYGTAAGFAVVALLPMMQRIVPMPGLGSLASSPGLTPQLLVEVPAGFAIIGYGIGIPVGIVVLCGTARNLLVRRILAPLLFILVLVGMTHFGFGPRGTLLSMVAAMPSVGAESCTDSAIVEHSGDPEWMLRALDACGRDSIYLDDSVFLWTGAIAVCILAAGRFVIDFRRDAMEAAVSD